MVQGLPPLSTTDMLPEPGAAKAARQARDLRQAAEGFEALLLNQLLKTSRETSFENELMGGQAVSTARSLLDQTLAEKSAGASGLGLADAIERQFSAVLPRRLE